MICCPIGTVVHPHNMMSHYYICYIQMEECTVRAWTWRDKVVVSSLHITLLTCYLFEYISITLNQLYHHYHLTWVNNTIIIIQYIITIVSKQLITIISIIIIIILCYHYSELILTLLLLFNYIILLKWVDRQRRICDFSRAFTLGCCDVRWGTYITLIRT